MEAKVRCGKQKHLLVSQETLVISGRFDGNDFTAWKSEIQKKAKRVLEIPKHALPLLKKVARRTQRCFSGRLVHNFEQTEDSVAEFSAGTFIGSKNRSVH
jgi:hypothetical protein